MANDPSNDPSVNDTPVDDEPDDDANRLEAYDLDGDGKVSITEDAKAQLGVVDARLEQAAEEGGLTGKLAEAAHQIVDKLDND